jgi:hypothetical protein
MVNVCMVIFSVFSQTLFGDILLNSVLVKKRDEGFGNNLTPVF